jgi:hypothetical protein
LIGGSPRNAGGVSRRASIHGHFGRGPTRLVARRERKLIDAASSHAENLKASRESVFLFVASG